MEQQTQPPCLGERHGGNGSTPVAGAMPAQFAEVAAAILQSTAEQTSIGTAVPVSDVIIGKNIQGGLLTNHK